jgi:transcription initiation factor TFIID TATA-box-binding protein
MPPTRHSSLAADNIPSTLRPQVHNVIAGVDLNCLVILADVALKLRNATYRPRRFPAVVVRQREPRSTALIFHSGKMQILGTKSVEDARLAGRKFARMLQKLGYQPRFENFNVQNSKLRSKSE